jgi:hypothetical protein
MSKNLITPQDIKILTESVHIQSCPPKYITFTPEFIAHALLLSAKGYTHREIFINTGLHVILNYKERVKETIKQWKRKDKLGQLHRKRGRPTKTEETDLHLRIKYLEEENAFLRKLRAKRAE